MDFYLIPQVTASGFGNKRSYDSASVALMPSRIGKGAVVSKTKGDPPLSPFYYFGSHRSLIQRGISERAKMTEPCPYTRAGASRT